ncbi:MAG: glycoside hydrolase family 2 [Chloroflexi bacterium]|nr:glycoside hydrolase family 2 [Chloroflexota bacterium]OJV95870.1 MAG: glycoside hydrolase family 2 [Chloroflexi bacterium 54-19]
MPYREEYPRPQFVRDNWLSLNGTWDFDFDDEQVGDTAKWYQNPTLSQKIEVPFCFQSELSGIGTNDFHDTVWYKRTFTIPASFEGQRVHLHFGAVDYEAWVWVNGVFVKHHQGGHTPFSAEITGQLKAGENEIVVKAQDYSLDLSLPRGKQFWKQKSAAIFYTRTTGIWQTVWLEATPPVYLERVVFTPDVDRGEIGIRAFIGGFKPGQNLRLRTRITFEGELVSEDEYSVVRDEESRSIRLYTTASEAHERWWFPEHPHLFEVEFNLTGEGGINDKVESYFGLRKVSVENGKVCLNNRPYYMRLVLDQGYFPEGVLTAPSDEALKKDVELTKAMGFNGARKHQKMEDPRYLYWCDRLGLLLWGEAANAYTYSVEYARRFVPEWMDAVARDINHPCVVAWVPLNESWGVPNVLVDKQQQDHALSLYYLTKSLDPSRPVISNDGWEHVKSDFTTIHDYEGRGEVLLKRYSNLESALDAPQKKEVYAEGYSYNGEPILITEFGGIFFSTTGGEGWGYTGADSEGDFIKRLTAVFQALRDAPLVQGFCYTQFTDVEQEMNGLLTPDREPKIPLDVIKKIVTGR